MAQRWAQFRWLKAHSRYGGWSAKESMKGMGTFCTGFKAFLTSAMANLPPILSDLGRWVALEGQLHSAAALLMEDVD